MNKIAKLFVSGLAMSMLVNANAPLTGEWGGDRANLTVDAKGARIEMDCAHGAITVPLKLDKAGRFTAKGMFARDHPGPDHINAPDPRRAATYAGTVSGSALTLMIRVTGEPTPQKLRLVKGARVKLLRCL
jgi:hypothetical protein